MAAYPTIPITYQSSPSRIDGYIPVRATNGTLKVRKLMTGEKMEWTLEHELTSTQRTDLENHYSAHKTTSFSFTWPGTGTSYTVMYTTAPLYLDQPGGWSKARVSLAEV